MCCRILVFVVCMLMLVLDVTPWRLRRQMVTTQAVTTRRIVQNYTRSKLTGTAITIPEIYPSDSYLIPSITAPIDNLIAARNKEPILHKAHKEAEYTTPPLEVDDMVIGINDEPIVDDYTNDNYLDEDNYEHYEKYIEDFWEETIYEFDGDDWEDK